MTVCGASPIRSRRRRATMTAASSTSSRNIGKTGFAIDGDKDHSEWRNSRPTALTRWVTPSSTAHRSTAATRQADSE
jgi:hypothetical protein